MLSRREFLKLIGTTSMLLVAGCTSQEPVENNTIEIDTREYLQGIASITEGEIELPSQLHSFYMQQILQDSLVAKARFRSTSILIFGYDDLHIAYGTGFLTNIGDKYYLVTIEHVADSIKSFTNRGIAIKDIGIGKLSMDGAFLVSSGTNAREKIVFIPLEADNLTDFISLNSLQAMPMRPRLEVGQQVYLPRHDTGLYTIGLVTQVSHGKAIISIAQGVVCEGRSGGAVLALDQNGVGYVVGVVSAGHGTEYTDNENECYLNIEVVLVPNWES